MRINRYILHAEINTGMYLYYNAFSDLFTILDQKRHDWLSHEDYQTIENEDPAFYRILIDDRFLVSDDYDEQAVVLYRKESLKANASLYQIMINPTLNCNLDCWYCYENKILDSRISKKVLSAIKKNIALEYELSRFNTLKVSFFGGEPFMDFPAIQEILDYAYHFCLEHKVELIADFTTNAVLITEEQIDYLSQFRCHFQITLDGDREVHNRIKKDHLHPDRDTYQRVLDVLSLIDTRIPNRWVAVRVNFDNRTLGKIDDIISDISFLDRKYCYVILKKVWQIETDHVDTDLLFTAIQKFFDHKFLLDYYIMPKGSVCFAERCREALINYDGLVFRCSTISKFDDSNSLGKLDLENGRIVWNEEKSAHWFHDITPEYCKTCKWFPACLGPCNKQLLLNPNKRICTFDAMNMGDKEYLMYAFKYRYLENELKGITY